MFTFNPFSLELSSSFDSSSPVSGTSGGASFSDEEVLLAARNPKKRAGRKKYKETRHPVYWGVRRRKSDKWVCEVREPNKKTRIWLGTFPTAEMAARAHDVAAMALRGRSARLNFADSAWRLPVPATAEAKDIQRTATEAAEAFRPPRNESVEEVAATEEQSVFYLEEEEKKTVMEVPQLLRDMALMSPTHCFGFEYEYDDVDVQDAEVSLWSF
ncbi:dehydration-responsive element-binding protein 1E-like [Gastrolobium bilobum]|uniref:dehydration-responsive element-binding protein 1E-like n=1 Tax=Gastrolobium bilobum TaxID=150636 RepID=UPI002AB15814|nr:dehydration-responsive element-binding protein 1E-like [Gastrolobium bilobum]